MTWNNQNVRQSAAAPGGVPGVLFLMSGTVGFLNQRICVERHDIDVAEDVSLVNSLPLFRSKDL